MGLLQQKKNESRLQPKQHKPVNNMEYEDGSAKEKDSADLQLDNNLDNGQKLKVLLMIHIIFIYIYAFFNMAKAEVNGVLCVLMPTQF